MLGPAREMPDLVHVLDDVALIEGFLQFGGTPGAHKTPFRLGVTTDSTSLGQRLGLFVVDAGAAEGKGEFASTAVG